MAHQKRKLNWCAIKNALRLYSCKMNCSGRAFGTDDESKVHIITRLSDGRTGWAGMAEYVTTGSVIARIKDVAEGERVP